MSFEELGNQEQKEYQKSPNFKEYLGLILIILGVLIAGWVFLNIYKIFTNPEQLTYFKELLPSQLEITTRIEGNDAKVLIPTEFMVYGIVLALMTIAVGVGSVLIKGGTRLVAGDIKRLSRKIDSIKEALGK